jgi:hypothetical protein
MVEAGETVDVELAKGEEPVAEWFGKGGNEPEAEQSPAEPASADDITSAIALLDPANDDHWTAAGVPAVDAVAELAGKPVTRAAITKAAPDAKRPEQSPAE